MNFKDQLTQIFMELKQLKNSWANYRNESYLFFFLFILFNSAKNIYFQWLVSYQQFTFHNFIFHLTLVISFSVLLFMGIGVLFRSKRVLIAIYVTQVLYEVINLTYFLYFKNYLFFGIALNLASEAFIVTKEGAFPLYYQVFLMLMDLPFFILLLRGKMFSIQDRKPKKILSIPLVLIPVLVLAASYHWREGHSDLAYAGDAKFVFEYGLLPAQMNKFLSSFKPGQDLISKLRKNTSSRELQIKGNGPEKNILIIQVEAMESGAVLAKFKGKPVMPFLNKLQKESVFYPFVLAYHLGGGTSDSEFTIINSVQPLRSYPTLKVDNYNFDNSFLKVLTNEGYRTYAFHGNLGTFWDRVRTFPKMGFEEFYDQIRMNLKTKGWGAPDKEVFEKADSIIREEKGLSLNYIITMSSHMPFDLTKSYYTNHDFDGIPNEEVRDYYKVMAYVDQALADFLKKAKEYSNTIILIVGDHGNGGLNKKWYMNSSFTENDTNYQFVPLYILDPDQTKHYVNDRAACFLDLAPTILTLSGISAKYHSEGGNLMRPDALTNKIPFLGEWYNRRHLYRMIIRKTGFNP